MPTIQLQTEIKSTLQICFDLSRSIDLHKISTAHTNETAIDGCTSGLIGLYEFVTWEAIHFRIKQHLTTKITALESPRYFRDEMIKGIFNLMKHDHYFEEKGGSILMTDIFEYRSPLGLLGKIADKLFLNKYMTNLLIKRNNKIKEFAESEKWKLILKTK